MFVCYFCFQDQPQFDLETKFVLFNGYLLFSFPSCFSFVADSSHRGVNVLSLFPEKHCALLSALTPACVLPHARAGFESLFCPGVQPRVSWTLKVWENL